LLIVIGISYSWIGAKHDFPAGGLAANPFDDSMLLSAGVTNWLEYTPPSIAVLFSELIYDFFDYLVDTFFWLNFLP